jgi:hypothetical protein
MPFVSAQILDLTNVTVLEKLVAVLNERVIRVEQDLASARSVSAANTSL